MAVRNRRAPRRARKARKAPMRKLRVRRALPSAMEKVYNYTFQPLDQWIASTANSTPGDIAIVPNQPPLSNASITSPVPAQSGFSFYYDMGVGMAFNLQQLSNFVAFTRIYDEYKINSIQVKMTYLTNEAQIVGAGLLPTINYVMDQDNAAAPLSLKDVQGKAGVKTLRISPSRNVLNLNIKPYTLTSVATPTGAFPAKVQRASWINTANTDIVHYAGKLWVQNMYLPVTTNSNTAIQFEYKFNVSFKGAKDLY